MMQPKSLLLLSFSVCFAVFVSQIFCDVPDVSKVGADAVKAWARNRLTEGEAEFKRFGAQRFPSPNYWGGHVVYQIVVDRFRNGNKTNDRLNVPEFQTEKQAKGEFDGIPSWRHGGDIQGIIDRLDYLEDLGVTSLWITPIFKHDGSYHGYCTTDLTTIDPGFGTNEEFRLLVQLAHARGIYVILDVVINHLCDTKTSYNPSPNDHHACSRDLDSNYWGGQSGGSDHQGNLQFSDGFFGPLKSNYFFSRCGANSGADTSGAGAEAVYGDFVSTMFDYDTRNYDFQEIFSLLVQYWISYADVDGFRLDAAKHVTEDFLAHFSTYTRAYAASVGKSNFYVVGEVAADSSWEGRRLGKMFSNPSNPQQHGNVPAGLTFKLNLLKNEYLKNKNAPYPGLDAVYDFAQSGTTRDVLLGNKATGELSRYFTSESFNTIGAQNDNRISWILLEIHDWPRYLHDDPFDSKKILSGLVTLMTIPGIPIIYYGLEQGFNGNCNKNNMHVAGATNEVVNECNANTDACFRQDMFMDGPWRLGSGIPEVDKMSYIGSWTANPWSDWKTDPYLQRDHAIYKTTRHLSFLHRSCDALSAGKIYFRTVDDQRGGMFTYSRLTGLQEIVVMVNPGLFSYPSPSSIVVDRSLNPKSGIKYVNVFNTQEDAYTSVQGDGTAYLVFSKPKQFNTDNFQIFIREDHLVFDEQLQIQICKSLF